MELNIIEKTPVTLTQVKQRLDGIKKEKKELNFRSNKVMEYVNDFAAKKPKDLEAKHKKIKELDITRLKDRHIIKILDLQPENLDALKLLLTGENLTLKQEDLKNIFEVTQS